MKPTFGGDDIDRMLEAGSRQQSYRGGGQYNGAYNAVPPPSHMDSSRPTRYDRNGQGLQGRRRRSRSRSRGRGRGGRDRDRGRGGHGGRGGRGGRGRGMYGRDGRSRGHGRGNDYFHHRPRSMSPIQNRYLTREEEEERRKEREQQDIERDQRTVFACQIHPKCDERDIFEFFSEIGKVIDVQLIRDNRTFKSKGLCYVEFEDKGSVAHALSLSGQSLGGFPVSVQLTQAEKNRAAQQAAQVAQQSRPMKLYVSNIHTKVTEEDIRPVFSAFGEILSLEIKCDHRDRSKGYGFVEFKKEIDAIGAMQQLNDLEILGQKIKVTAADQPSNGISHIIGASAPNGIGSSRIHHNDLDNTNTYSSQSTKISEESGNGGLALSTADKLALMQKLGRGTVKTNVSKSTATSNNDKNKESLPAHIQTPTSYSSYGASNNINNNNNNNGNNGKMSRCVILSNMFNPATETDPDFDLEIREDVMEEVSKFGKLLHIYVDKTAKEGLVYLKFSQISEATMTINNLHGRWFAKNQIKATYSDEKIYNHQFQL